MGSGTDPLNNLFGPYELNDATGLTTDGRINGSGPARSTRRSATALYGLRDVDIFRVVANSGTTIQAFTSKLSANLDTIVHLRRQRNELAIDRRRASRGAGQLRRRQRRRLLHRRLRRQPTDPLNFGTRLQPARRRERDGDRRHRHVHAPDLRHRRHRRVVDCPRGQPAHRRPQHRRDDRPEDRRHAPAGIKSGDNEYPAPGPAQGELFRLHRRRLHRHEQRRRQPDRPGPVAGQRRATMPTGALVRASTAACDQNAVALASASTTVSSPSTSPSRTSRATPSTTLAWVEAQRQSGPELRRGRQRDLQRRQTPRDVWPPARRTD